MYHVCYWMCDFYYTFCFPSNTVLHGTCFFLQLTLNVCLEKVPLSPPPRFVRTLTAAMVQATVTGTNISVKQQHWNGLDVFDFG